MFDAHIQYYAYNNTKNDDFGVGYLGNKQFWCDIITRWNRNDNHPHRVHVEDWDELDCDTDFRGCQIAEVVPDGDNFNVYWVDGDNENSMIIGSDGTISWENNPQNKSSVPRWVTKLKNQLRDMEN